MKLGACYMVFDGEELLKFAIKSVRSEIDYISVTYQNISYFGNKSDCNLFSFLKDLEREKLIDEIILYEPDLTIHHKENELRLRNIGLEASKKAGCSHHISFDVDEFYTQKELSYAKKVMEDDFDFSIVPILTYYKDPTFLVYPDLNCYCTFIHPVNNKYEKDNCLFPFKIETTRRFEKYGNFKIFKKEEICQHHMSYVRKNIRKKFDNSDNARFYKIEKFIKSFENYELGGRVCLIPDFINRKTIQVENIFEINL